MANTTVGSLLWRLFHQYQAYRSTKWMLIDHMLLLCSQQCQCVRQFPWNRCLICMENLGLFGRISQVIVNEELEYAVVGKFSYVWPDIQELRKIISKQCELKGDVNIGLLCNRYVLIRTSRIEDYVNLLQNQFLYCT